MEKCAFFTQVLWVCLVCFPVISASEETPKNTISATQVPDTAILLNKTQHDSLIINEVRSHVLTLRNLYEKYVNSDMVGGGRLALSVVLDKSGRVMARPEIRKYTLKSKDFMDRVVDTVMTWNFGTLAEKVGTDTLQFTLSFGVAGDLVRVTAVDAQIDGKKVEWLREVIGEQLPEIKKTYLNWVGFYGSVDGMAKVQVHFNPLGKADDIIVVWNSGLPPALMDSLHSAMGRIKKAYLSQCKSTSVATAYIRFEDLHNDPVLLMAGDVKTMPVWLQALINHAMSSSCMPQMQTAPSHFNH